MIVIGGRQLDVPDVVTSSWLDDPKRVPRQVKKTTPRTRQIRSIVVHSVTGLRGKFLAGAGPSGKAFAYARSQVSGSRQASWDYTVDLDGRILAQNDPLTAFTWHASQVNGVSVGIEMTTLPDGTQFEATVNACASLVNALCELLGIQKQTCWDHVHDRPYASRIERLDPGRGGVDLVGVLGHRNVWTRSGAKIVPARGSGDPNDYVFHRLVSAHGFERFDFTGDDPEDLRVWRGRQAAVGVASDGLPLRDTVRALKKFGHANGIWADGSSEVATVDPKR